MIDATGLAAIALFLLDTVRPELLFLPTITAGGDTPSHYPTLVALYERFLPRYRLHGWDPGGYLGYPLLLYYFPLPYVVMAVFAPLTGLPVAFKLGSILGVFLFPLFTYLSFRLMGLRFPTPLLGAAAATVFLFLEENPIWGGTLASTLTGEFAYTYGIGLAVLFLGFLYRSYSRGASPWGPATILGATAFAHGYAVLWAGLSATHFLYRTRRPWKTLTWLAAVALLSLAFAAVWLWPLLVGWGWTTPFNDAWITVETENLLPPYLAPLVIPGVIGWVWALTWGRRRGADQRLLLLLHAAAVAVALAAAGPGLGIIDVRFLPFAQLAACLAGAVTLGLVISRFSFVPAALAALGLLIGGIVYADANSRLVRFWAEWNYTGIEAKQLWPRFREMAEHLEGSVADPRVAVEYSLEHERAGSIRMYEILPHFTGRSTLEGVYNQASPNTHAVYYLTSELGERSPNPFRNVEFSAFDTDNAVRHLRMFNTREIVALSGKLSQVLSERSDVLRVATVPPYTIFRLRDSGPGYVEALRYQPVRSSMAGWRSKAYRWFSRKPASDVHLVFTDDPRFELEEADEWLEPPAVPLATDVQVRAILSEEAIEIDTDRADGPYLVSPAMMLIIPRQEKVRLHYGRNSADDVGLGLTLAFLIGAVLRRTPVGRRLRGFWRRSPPPEVIPSFVVQCAYPPSPRRWGGIIPVGLLLGLVALRFTPGPEVAASAQADSLKTWALEALAQQRFEDAAEYARHGIRLTRHRAGHIEFRLVRAEALLLSGRLDESIELAQQIVDRASAVAHRRRALTLLISAHLAAGDAVAAQLAGEQLRREPMAAGVLQVGEP